MAERDPVDLIKEQGGKVDGLVGLHADHEAFVRWQSETRTILDKVFGTKSIHYQSFAALRFREMALKSFASPEIDKINTARYKKDLESARNLLQGAIKELTLDRTLFKKIQTTPKTVEVSLEGEYFVSPAAIDFKIVQAIGSAFEGSGLKPIPSPEANTQGGPLYRRIEQIKRAKFGIYDLSGPEMTDVLLELGAALGLGRTVTIIYKKGAFLPKSMRYLDPVDYADLSDLTEKLRKRIKA